MTAPRFELLGSPNYAAQVVQVESQNLVELQGLDNLVGFRAIGAQALVTKDTAGIGIVIPAGTVLSAELIRVNSLSRDPEQNRDPEVTGYVAKDRRVKALRLRGHQSDALFLPAAALTELGVAEADLVPGTAFDTIDGVEIVHKYERPVKPGSQQLPKQREINKLFPEHDDTLSFWRSPERLPAGERIVITQKLHGTSIRAGHIPVPRTLSWLEKLAARFGVKVQKTEYDYVFGSRRVTKSTLAGHAELRDKNGNHYYAEDLWSREGAKLVGTLPKNTLIFGELVGWVGESPIQKGYTYDVPKGQVELYVYRVAVINEDGDVVDLSWEGVRQFCELHGLKNVPELEQFHMTPIPQDTVKYVQDLFTDRRYADMVGYGWTDAPLPLSDKKSVDEGVVLRWDGISPVALKAKAPQFLNWESRLMDEGVNDLEETGEVAA